MCFRVMCFQVCIRIQPPGQGDAQTQFNPRTWSGISKTPPNAVAPVGCPNSLFGERAKSSISPKFAPFCIANPWDCDAAGEKTATG
jgi:hypothetical protein